MHTVSWLSHRPRPAHLVAAARAVAQRAPETLMVVRYRAQPTLATISRQASTAILAYLLALLLPLTPRPVLAPLTALLVSQVTLYQTVRSAVRRVVAVVAGVLLAVVLSAFVGFTWWSLGLTIAVGLAVGYALHLGDTVLEVPISAMLILSVGTIRTAATGRVVETLIGAAAGLLAELVFARPRVQPAAEAVDELCRTMAGLVADMAAGIRDGTVFDKSSGWLARAGMLGGEIRRVDDALHQAEDSVRLAPHRTQLARLWAELRAAVETLEHAAITVRVLARSLDDSTRLSGEESPIRDQQIRLELGTALAELAAALRDYGRLGLERDASGRELIKSDLRRHLDAVRDREDQLSRLLATDPATQPASWPLRGELASLIDQLRTELEAGSAAGEVARRRPRRHATRRPDLTRSLRAALQAGRRPASRIRPFRPRRTMGGAPIRRHARRLIPGAGRSLVLRARSH